MPARRADLWGLHSLPQYSSNAKHCNATFRSVCVLGRVCSPLSGSAECFPLGFGRDSRYHVFRVGIQPLALFLGEQLAARVAARLPAVRGELRLPKSGYR